MRVLWRTDFQTLLDVLGRSERQIYGPSLRDDGAGPEAAQQLHDAPSLEVVTCRPLDLVVHLENVTAALLIDASHPDGFPGRIARYDLNRSEVPTHRAVSSHGMGLVNAIALAKILGCVPDNFVLLTIEAEGTGQGHGLSDAVRAALPELVSMAEDEVATWLHATSPA